MCAHTSVCGKHLLHGSGSPPDGFTLWDLKCFLERLSALCTRRFMLTPEAQQRLSLYAPRCCTVDKLVRLSRFRVLSRRFDWRTAEVLCLKSCPSISPKSSHWSPEPISFTYCGDESRSNCCKLT